MVKASDSKSDSLWERRFESYRLRILFVGFAVETSPAPTIFVGCSTISQLARWSRGMIRASGARGPGFKSRTSPTLFAFNT